MAKLTTKGRKRMKSKQFAIPKEKAYPINDKARSGSEEGQEQEVLRLSTLRRSLQRSAAAASR